MDSIGNIVGLRPAYELAIDFPSEVGFACPLATRSKPHHLLWSEFNGYLWCENCKKDIPSCFCVDKLDKAMAIYLKCVEDARQR